MLALRILSFLLPADDKEESVLRTAVVFGRTTRLFLTPKRAGFGFPSSNRWISVPHDTQCWFVPSLHLWSVYSIHYFAVLHGSQDFFMYFVDNEAMRVDDPPSVRSCFLDLLSVRWITVVFSSIWWEIEAIFLCATLGYYILLLFATCISSGLRVRAPRRTCTYPPVWAL
jgi:hypothetical protein